MASMDSVSQTRKEAFQIFTDICDDGVMGGGSHMRVGAVERHIGGRGFERGCADVDAAYARRAAGGGIDREAAAVSEQIDHAATSGEGADVRAVIALVEE